MTSTITGVGPVQERYEQQLSDLFGTAVDQLCDAVESVQLDAGVKEFQKVGPHAREKLKGILQHYAKKPKPFTACVRDQIKHGLSQEMANRRCAVIKDLIMGTTKWRGHPDVAPQSQYLSDVEIDDETTRLLLAISELPDFYETLGLDDPNIDVAGG